MLGQGTVKHDSRVQVGESRSRGRVGKVVSRYINGLDGSDRTFLVEVMRSCKLPISCAKLGW